MRVFCIILTLIFVTPVNARERQFELEPMVVTAQKRTQDPLDVPITMHSFSGKQLERLVANSLPDLIPNLPNIELFDDSGVQPTWFIRGVGLTDWNANSTPTTAVYIDEIYQPSNVMGNIPLFDVDRIEVLKGPQGGLYGRNACGGALRVMTREPSLRERDGSAAISYERWGHYNFDGAFGGPVSNQIGLRIATRMEKGRGGWQETFAGGEEHGEPDSWGVRGQLLFVPMDNAEILFKIEAVQDRSEITLGRAIGVYNEEGDYCNAIQAGGRDDNCLTYAGMIDYFEGGTGDPRPSVQARDGSRVLSDPLSRKDNNATTITALAMVDFSSATFTSISGYQAFDYRSLIDYDGQTGEFGHQDDQADISALSQEFRLTSTTLGPWTWIMGATYGVDKLVEDRLFLFRENIYVTEAFELPSARDGIVNLAYTQETESWAIYGETGYMFSPQYRVNAALRYTYEHKGYKNGAFTLPELDDAILEGVDKDYALEKNWSGKIGLDWLPRKNAMVYSHISRGFKCGGFFGGFPDEDAQVDPYREEILWAYEVGSKITWHKLQLNLAAFVYDYRDKQGYSEFLSPVTETVVTRLTNIGDARHRGGELDIWWAPIKDLILKL